MKFIKFYVVMVLAILCLLGNVIWQEHVIGQKEDAASLGRYETLSYHECATRFLAMREILSGSPKNPREYFNTIGRAYMILGAAQKALATLHTPYDEVGAGSDRDAAIVRNIPIEMQTLISDYQSKRKGLVYMSKEETAQWDAAAKEFTASGMDPAISPHNAPPISGTEKRALWWGLFQFGAIPFIFVHYCIRIRDNKMKVLFELLGNPMVLALWLVAWEVGLFRYPKEISVMAQIRRVRQWAVCVLSSAIPCFAANANPKVCDNEPVHASFSTSTMSRYPGLEGAIFYQYPVQQSSITVSGPCGTYAGVWDSEPLNHRRVEPNYGREVDLLAGWSNPIKGTTVDLTATYLNVSPLLQIPRGDVVQLSERVSKNLSFDKRNSVQPYVWFREAFPVRGSTPIGGWFAHGGITFLDSFGDRPSNALTFEVLRDSGAFGYNKGYIGRLLETFTWKLGKRSSFQVPVVITTPLSHTGDGRKTRITAGIAYSVSFGH